MLLIKLNFAEKGKNYLLIGDYLLAFCLHFWSQPPFRMNFCLMVLSFISWHSFWLFFWVEVYLPVRYFLNMHRLRQELQPPWFRVQYLKSF